MTLKSYHFHYPFQTCLLKIKTIKVYFFWILNVFNCPVYTSVLADIVYEKMCKYTTPETITLYVERDLNHFKQKYWRTRGQRGLSASGASPCTKVTNATMLCWPGCASVNLMVLFRILSLRRLFPKSFCGFLKMI